MEDSNGHPESSSSQAGEQGNRQQQGAGGDPNPQPRGLGDIFIHLVEKKIETLLWLSRMATMVFTVFYLFGGLGGNPHSQYQKALISNAVTSALRLHQRMPTVRLSREFLAVLLLEDSCHYLMYSLIFIFSSPITLVLLPPSLFALLHSSQFSLILLAKLGMEAGRLSEALRALLQTHRVKVFRMIAMAEIFLMPTVIVGVFGGRASLLAPFMYYRFLSLRYSSRRNPYSRNVFYELRIQAHMVAAHASCPSIISRGINTAVRQISNLAPPVLAQ